MTDITQLAKGKSCMVRIPGICNRRAETTVPAHYSLVGVSGRSIKSPPTCVAWACSDCHDVVDGRVNPWKAENAKEAENIQNKIKRYHGDGVIRTLDALDKLGYEMVLIGGGKIPKIVPRRVA